MGICVVSILCVLWKILRWIFVYQFLHWHVFWNLLGMSSGVEWPRQMGLGLTRWGTARLSSEAAAPSHVLTSSGRGSNSPHPCQHLLVSDFLIPAVLVGVKWCLTVVLVCVSLIANDVEHLSLRVLSICVYYLETSILRSFALLFSQVSVFLITSGRSCLDSPDASPLSEVWLANTSSDLVGCLFTFLMVLLDTQKFLIWVKSSLSLLLSCWLWFWCHWHLFF